MKNSVFRKNLSKCLYNDTGYCKFKEKCRNLHSSGICQKDDCNKSCPERHPKACRFSEKCKFLEKGICVFNHRYGESDKEKFEKRIKEVEKSFELYIDSFD